MGKKGFSNAKQKYSHEECAAPKQKDGHEEGKKGKKKSPQPYTNPFKNRKTVHILQYVFRNNMTIMV